MSAESPLVVQVNIKNVLELGFSSRLRIGAEKRNLKNLQKSEVTKLPSDSVFVSFS